MDDQNGFTLNLLNDISYEVTLSGDHALTTEGDWAVFVPLSNGSCVGASSLDAHYGGPIDSSYSFSVQLSASSLQYALCLAHQPFNGTRPSESDFEYHPHVLAVLAFEPPSSPPPP